MQRLRKLVTSMAVGAMLLTSGLTVQAQSTPGATQADPKFQPAAVTLGSEDLPTGYIFVGETFLDATQLAENGVDGNALTSAGFTGQYVSVYQNPDTGERIRAYASLWPDATAAESGFALLEDEAVSNPNDALSDTAADVGEEPRETTTGTYTDEEGNAVGTVDVSFRRGPMVIGVAHETLDGSEADPALAADLAARMDERAQAILANESLPHVDMALPGQVVHFDDEGNGLAQAGFLGPVEVESIYDVQGSLLSGVQSAWVETTLIGGTASSPTVTIALSTFANEENAALVVEQAGDLFPPFPGQEAVEGVTLDRAEAVAAYRYASTDGGSVDSYRLLFSLNGKLTVIDVQRAAADGGAEEAALAIAQAEIACQANGACEAPALPGSLTGQ